MSEQTTGCNITRVTFLGQKEWLGCSIFTALKYAVSRVEGATSTILEPQIIYELPKEQIVRPVCKDDAKYFIVVDDEGIVTSCCVDNHIADTLYEVPPSDLNYTGINLQRIVQSTGSFIIKENACFCDITVCTSRLQTTCTVNNIGCTFFFIEAYKCAYKTGVVPGDKLTKMYFKEPPIHKVELVINDHDVPDSSILQVVNQFMPSALHVTVPSSRLVDQPVDDSTKEV